MLKTLRTQTKTIMWLVAISFVALMVLDWGMDFTGRGASTVGDTVGEVNGEKISWSQYESALSNNRRMYMERNRGEFPEFAEKILAEQTWDNLVGETLLRQEAKRLGVHVTDADVLVQIQTNPPREVLELEVFQTNGQFDPQKYEQALADPRFDWTWLENYVRAYLPQQKIQDRVVSSVVVSDVEAREEYARRNDKVSVSYVYFRPDEHPSAGFTPSSEALHAYYEAHPQEFASPPMITLSFARLPKTVTDADIRTAEEDALEAKREFEGGVPFEDLAPDYSSAPNASSGGDMGWVMRGGVDDPAAEAVLFAMTEPGSVSKPVRGTKGVYLFQLVERDGDRVHARQILIHPEPGHDTVSGLISRAEDVRKRAADGPLASAASQGGMESKVLGPFEQGRTPPELVSYPSAVRFMNEAKAGEMSPVLNEKDAVVLLQVTQKTEAGMRPEAEVRDQLIEAVTFEARLERAVRVAEEFSRAAQSGDFAAVARSRGLTAKETPLFTRSTPPPDLAPMQAAQAMAFSLPVGQVSPPVRERIACFVMKVNEHQVATSEDFARERESIMAELLYRKRQETFTAWYEELRASARIEDRREALLASAESDEEMDEEEDSE